MPADDALLVTGERSRGAGRRGKRCAREGGPLGEGAGLLQGDAVGEREGAGRAVGRFRLGRVVRLRDGRAEGADPEGAGGGGKRGKRGRVRARVLGRAVDNRKTDGESNSAGKASVKRGREKTTSIDVHGREISERRGALDAGDPASNEERGDWLEAAGFVLRVEVGLLVESEVDAKRCAIFAVGKKGGGGACELGPAVLEDVLRAADDGGIRLGKEREGSVGGQVWLAGEVRDVVFV